MAKISMAETDQLRAVRMLQEYGISSSNPAYLIELLVEAQRIAREDERAKCESELADARRTIDAAEKTIGILRSRQPGGAK